MIKNKILIIDDDGITRKSLEKELNVKGYDVYLSDNGNDGLAKTKSINPDLILLDVMMPEINGFEVCQRIRANPLIAEVPIVMITSLNDLDSRLTGLEAGADDFILKPFNKVELLAKVRTITRLNRYRRLLNERTRLEWVVEQSDEGYLIIDQNDRIHYANKKAQIYLGLNKDYRQQKPFFIQIVQRKYKCEPKENWYDWTLHIADEANPERYLVLPESETSNAIWLQVTSFLQTSGKSDQFLIQLRDVTHLMASQRDIITFHRILNHKLRTPLSSLKISIEVLADNKMDLSPDERIKIAHTAQQSIKRLKGVISDISKFLDAPRQSEGTTPVKLEDIEGIISSIQKTLKIQSIKVSIDDSIKKQMISLSLKELELLFWELLENSKKFHPDKNPRVEIYIRLENRSVLIQIMDNGSELTPDQINKVWLPYYQAEKYFTGEVSGTGLGLSYVSTLIWQKGGSCTINNRNPSPGIVVELSLPAIT